MRQAERITNERLLDALPALYAPDAVFTSVTDGVVSKAQGADEVLRAWRVFFAFLGARDFSLTKRLVVAADGVLVNEWTGSLAGRTHATGVEVWRFDGDGLIAEHAPVQPAEHPARVECRAALAGVAVVSVDRAGISPRGAKIDALTRVAEEPS